MASRRSAPPASQSCGTTRPKRSRARPGTSMASAIVRMYASTSKTSAPRSSSTPMSIRSSTLTARFIWSILLTLNLASRRARVTRRAQMKVRKSQLDVPADSFAGASGLMMMVTNLRHGSREIRFHAFACAPGPEIFSVKASLPAQSEHWRFYSGDLFRLDMRPDLGALSLLIAPFLPTMDAWFSPADNWNYVGGEFDRYFRGPHVLTVRVPPAN